MPRLNELPRKIRARRLPRSCRANSRHPHPHFLAKEASKQDPSDSEKLHLCSARAGDGDGAKSFLVAPRLRIRLVRELSEVPGTLSLPGTPGLRVLENTDIEQKIGRP